MPHFSVVLAAIAGVSYVVFTVLDRIITRRRILAKGRELGCQDPPEEKFRLPFSIDSVQQALAADREKLFPDWLISRAQNMGVTTWKMKLFGQNVFVTSEPQNIQAILATQFGTYDLGPFRRGVVCSAGGASCPLCTEVVLTGSSSGPCWETASSRNRAPTGSTRAR